MITLRKFGMNENEIIKYEKDNEQKLSKKVKNLYLKMDLFTNLDEKYKQLIKAKNNAKIILNIFLFVICNK